MISKAQIKRQLKKIVAIHERKKLYNKEFSIISNSCFSGAVYDKYALPYLTPTIGLWIPAHDYVKFCSDLKYYLQQELKKISWKECHVRKLLEERYHAGRYKSLDDMVIGRLADIDIIFLHYSSFDEAKEKWNRRRERVKYDKLIIKFSDHNDFKKEDFLLFSELEYKNKLFFTADATIRGEYVYFFENDAKYGHVIDDTKINKLPLDITAYLNSIE